MEEIILKVENMTITDIATDLFNRRYFETALHREYERAIRFRARLSCMVIDIDNFRETGEKYGQEAGNAMLKQIARLLKSCVRGIDIVARWGGEEFAILLPETSAEDASSVGARILKVVAAQEFPDISEMVTLSIGVAGIPDSSIESTGNLVHEADLALYEAKRKGGNTVELA